MKALVGTLLSVALATSIALAADEKKPTLEPSEKASSPQGEKMKACNKDAAAKALKGDERRKFMSDCLRGDRKS